jgi:flagellar FliJ protein
VSPASRFRFSLETVLKVRTLREEQSRWEVARAHQQLERTRQAMADTAARREQLLAELAVASSRDWDVQEYQLYQLHLDSLHSALLAWKEKISQEEGELELKRQILLKRHQKRRLLERLREKKAAQHKREIACVMDRESEAINLGRWSGGTRSHHGEE